MTCNCDVGMCTHRPDCRQMRRSQPTDRDGNAIRHGTRDKLNRLRARLAGDPSLQNLVGVLKGMIDVLEDEL